MSSQNTQLSDVKNYDTERMIFSTPKEEPIPGSTLKGRRVFISTKNKDGTVGELIFPTDKLFSYGINENTSNSNQKEVIGYQMRLYMYNNEKPTEHQKMFVKTIDKITKKCIEHILSIKNQVGRKHLEERDLTVIKPLDPLWWKKNEEGEKIEGEGPSLFARLITKKNGSNFTFLTKITEEGTGKKIKPLDLLERKCKVKAAIKVESIYFSSQKISLLLKIYQAEVETCEQKIKNILAVPENDDFCNLEDNEEEGVVEGDGDGDDVEFTIPEGDSDADSVGSLTKTEVEEKPKTKPKPKPKLRKPVTKTK